MLTSFLGKIQRGFSHFVWTRRYNELRRYLSNSPDGFEAATRVVPGDVMEGHFAVIAVKGEETKGFIVDLVFLSEPTFLGLLGRAREDYGFKHESSCYPLLASRAAADS